MLVIEARGRSEAKYKLMDGNGLIDKSRRYAC